jgi:hypothetical protein
MDHWRSHRRDGQRSHRTGRPGFGGIGVLRQSFRRGSEMRDIEADVLFRHRLPKNIALIRADTISPAMALCFHGFMPARPARCRTSIP